MKTGHRKHEHLIFALSKGGFVSVVVFIDREKVAEPIFSLRSAWIVFVIGNLNSWDFFRETGNNPKWQKCQQHVIKSLRKILYVDK